MIDLLILILGFGKKTTFGAILFLNNFIKKESIKWEENI